MTPDKPGKGNDGAADPDASDLDGLIAERDRVRAELERIRREKREAEIELAILKGAVELVGKERGADPDNLTNREKTILVRTIGAGHGVPVGRLLARVGLARSTYYHQLNAMNRPDRDASLLGLVREAFENSGRRYGYKRVHLELRGMGIRVSAKRVMRLMTRHGLVPLLKRARRYSSYKGEIGGEAPDNLVNRDFHAEGPNRLWVTDLTEFRIPAGKVYLSPVIDCYDGMPVSWTIGTSPNAELANRMLRDACSTLGDGEHPIIHSDRGCHYRWPGWIRICGERKLTRSMSAKGCSPDNAAAEGFFGRLKQGGWCCFVGLAVDSITTDHAARLGIPRRSMMPVPGFRLDPLVPVPDHVVIQHADEPAHGDAREAASWRLNERIIVCPVPRNDSARWSCTSPRR